MWGREKRGSESQSSIHKIKGCFTRSLSCSCEKIEVKKKKSVIVAAFLQQKRYKRIKEKKKMYLSGDLILHEIISIVVTK